MSDPAQVVPVFLRNWGKIWETRTFVIILNERGFFFSLRNEFLFEILNCSSEKFPPVPV